MPTRRQTYRTLDELPGNPENTASTRQRLSYLLRRITGI
jgi:hypothetical protein